MAQKPWAPPPREVVLAAAAEARSIQNLAQLLGCAENTLRRHAPALGLDLSEFRSRGGNPATRATIAGLADELTDEELLELCEERGIPVLTEPIREDREFDLTTPTFDGQGSFRVGVVSDTHGGSKYQQITWLNAAYDYFERHEIDTVINAGDLTGGADSMHPGMVHELFAHGSDEQRDVVCETYPLRSGITTHAISGNHDHSHMKRGGANVVANIAKEREDIRYLGMSGAYLTINGIRIYVHHPSGGIPYARSWRLQKTIEQFAPEKKPKVLIQGHLHVTCVLESYRNVYGFLAGCFEAQTPYEVEKGLYPELGFSVLEITYDDDGAVKFRKEWVPFYIPLTRDYRSP